MAYQKQEWRDGAGGTTPLSAQRLNAMEQGIYAADAAANAGVQPATVGSSQIIDGSVGDPEIAANRFLVGSGAATEAIQDIVGAMSTGWTYDDAAGTITLPSPGTSTGAAYDDVVDANDPAYQGGMATTKTAAQNGAALQAAIIAAAGRPVTAKAGDYKVSGASITDQHVVLDMPGVWFQQDTTDDTCLTIERTPATPMAVGATYLTWWGPYQPTGVTVSGLLQVIPVPAGGFNRFKGGRVYHICSRDIFPWAWSALNLYNVGDTPVYTQTDGLINQAEQFPLLGIGLVVSSIVNGGPREQMMVQGATSGAQGLVQSSLTGNATGGITASQAHITFTSVTGDFVDGENLTRIAGGNPSGSSTVGQVVGVVTGAPVLLTSDIFILQYGRTATGTAGTNTPNRTDNTVQLREIDTKPMCRIDVGCDTVGSREAPDTYQTSRPGAFSLRGVYAPQVKWRVRNAWTRAMQVWSSYMGYFEGFVDQMANHALLDQSAFAYGLELKSGSKANTVNLRGHTVRHLFTTNPNQRTYSSANNYDAGKWTQWDYGTPIRNTIENFVVEAAFAPGMDTHPGDYYTLFRNGRIAGGGSGGRYNTDNNSAYSARGFGTTWENVEADSSVVGFNIGGVEHDAGFTHRYKLINVSVRNALAQAVFCPTAMVPGQAIIEVDGGSYSCRTTYPKDAAGTAEPTSQKYGVQTLFQIGSGVSLEVSGETKMRRFNNAAIVTKGTGDVVIWSAAVDFTDCLASACAVRHDPGTNVSSPVFVYEMKVRGTPASVLRNQTGNSTWYLGDIQWLGTGSQPPLTAVTNGTPTFTQIPPMTNAGGGSAAATHNVSVAPTLTAQTAAGTGPTLAFTPGSNDVSGEIRLTVGTSPTAGAQVRLNYGTAFGADVFPTIGAGLNVHTRALGYSTHDATGVTFTFGNAPTASTEYRWSYYVPGV